MDGILSSNVDNGKLKPSANNSESQVVSLHIKDFVTVRKLFEFLQSKIQAKARITRADIWEAGMQTGELKKGLTEVLSRFEGKKKKVRGNTPVVR